MKTIKQPICPITYEPLSMGAKYSHKGLKLLSLKLHSLNKLPYSAEQQRTEARQRSDKMSIQGVQLKLSANLDFETQGFKICSAGGNYILKPPNELYPELPENEDLTMRLAALLIEIPLHGLIQSIDDSYTYFIKRFDRLPRGKKLATEDFSQLAGLARETKYAFTMEKIILILEKYCTFPAIEKVKLFKLTLFNYLVGNEDMHLKNFSLISRDDKIELSPGYDLINTTIAMGKAKEEIALPLHGKKNNITRKDMIDYFGIERLSLNRSIMNEVLKDFKAAIPEWRQLIKISFLSEGSKENYLRLLETRTKVMGLDMLK